MRSVVAGAAGFVVLTLLGGIASAQPQTSGDGPDRETKRVMCFVEVMGSFAEDQKEIEFPTPWDKEIAALEEKIIEHQKIESIDDPWIARMTDLSTAQGNLQIKADDMRQIAREKIAAEKCGGYPANHDHSHDQ